MMEYFPYGKNCHVVSNFLLLPLKDMGLLMLHTGNGAKGWHTVLVHGPKASNIYPFSIHFLFTFFRVSDEILIQKYYVTSFVCAIHSNSLDLLGKCVHSIKLQNKYACIMNDERCEDALVWLLRVHWHRLVILSLNWRGLKSH